jgi:hypothetical protein
MFYTEGVFFLRFYVLSLQKGKLLNQFYKN